MQITLSKKDIEFLNRLVEDNERHCQTYGFNTTDNKKLMGKFAKALQGGKTSGKKT